MKNTLKENAKRIALHMEQEDFIEALYKEIIN